jgi:hypothetical protein
MVKHEKIIVRRDASGEIIYSKRGAIILCKGGVYYGLTNREQVNIIILITKITVERIIKWSIRNGRMYLQCIKRRKD